MIWITFVGTVVAKSNCVVLCRWLWRIVGDKREETLSGNSNDVSFRFVVPWALNDRDVARFNEEAGRCRFQEAVKSRGESSPQRQEEGHSRQTSSTRYSRGNDHDDEQNHDDDDDGGDGSDVRRAAKWAIWTSRGRKRWRLSSVSSISRAPAPRKTRGDISRVLTRLMLRERFNFLCSLVKRGTHRGV